MSGEDNHLPGKVAGCEVNEVADGLVIFDPATQQVHYLNSTASIVYELCNGTTSTAEVIGSASALFSGSASQDQLAECLDDLVRRGLVA